MALSQGLQTDSPTMTGPYCRDGSPEQQPLDVHLQTTLRTVTSCLGGLSLPSLHMGSAVRPPSPCWSD